MNTKTETAIKVFLRSLDIDNLYIDDYVQYENIDLNNPFDSIYNMIADNNGFDVEIIYYYNAIEYLKENDASLKDSLLLAHENGIEITDLSSEILASLLATQKLHEDFYSKKTENETL